MFAKLLRRPVLSVVMSIVIVLLGLLAIVERPISQFPEIAPPQVQITVAVEIRRSQAGQPEVVGVRRLENAIARRNVGE